ncbi:Uncharacterised protein [Providencia rettgeri]|nr:Uncharacterised protein [Providencia rettgeri]
MSNAAKVISINDHLDIDNAWTIPARYYTSNDVFEYEKEKYLLIHGFVSLMLVK